MGDKLEDFKEDLTALCNQYWGEEYKIKHLFTGINPDSMELEHKIQVKFDYGKLAG